MARRRLLRGLSADARVWLVVIVLVLTWGLALLVPPPVVPDGMVRPPWWVFILLFAVAEVWVFEIKFRRQEQAIFIGELPLVVGLFTLNPLLLVVTRAFVSGGLTLLQARSSLLKSSFNTALAGAGNTAAALVFSLISQQAGPLDFRAWLAVLAAITAMAVVEEISLNTVFGFYDGWVPLKTAIRKALQNLPLSLITGVIGLAAAAVLTFGSQTVPPLLFGTGAIFASYRAYAALVKRHQSLEKLFDLSGDLYQARSVDDVAAASWLTQSDWLEGSRVSFS